MISSHQIHAIAPSFAAREIDVAATFPARALRTATQVGYVELVGRLDKQTMVAARMRIQELAASAHVGEIVLLVDSPGGTLAGVHDLSTAIARAAEQKRVTAVVEDMAGSAAYYAIAGASEIVVNTTGAVGSIGVFVVLKDASKMFEKLGIDMVVIRSGARKGAGVRGAKITGEDIEAIQEIIDIQARHFVAAVARGRKMKVERVNDLADGRLLVGSQAIAAGLADRIGTIEDVLAEATGRVEHLLYSELSGWDARRKYEELVGEYFPELASEPFANHAQANMRMRHPRLTENAAACWAATKN